MSLELEISLLTQATTDLLSAVNVKKATLDASVEEAQDAAQAAESFVDALVASPTVERIEVVTTAQYGEITPVAGTLYVIGG